jgi:hypothetical protein
MDMLQQDPHLAKAINRRDNVLRRAQDTASWWKDEAHDLQAELGEVKKNTASSRKSSTWQRRSWKAMGA